jgi:electron transfer flavoprotein beta subunit
VITFASFFNLSTNCSISSTIIPAALSGGGETFKVFCLGDKSRPKSDESGPDLSNAKMAINPFCEIAIEEAVRIKEAGNAEEVIAVSVGDASSQEQLRTCLALGADRAILVETDESVEPLGVAKALKEVVSKESPDLIILGKQAIDGDANQTGQMLAAMLDLPQGTFASEVEIQDGVVQVTREIDGGLQTLSLTMPAIITTDLRLNEPRYASLPNIMKAKKKPLETLSSSDLGLDLSPRQNTLKVTPPPERAAGIMVDDIEQLVDKLKNEAKVIT